MLRRVSGSQVGLAPQAQKVCEDAGGSLAALRSLSQVRLQRGMLQAVRRTPRVMPHAAAALRTAKRNCGPRMRHTVELALVPQATPFAYSYPCDTLGHRPGLRFRLRACAEPRCCGNARKYVRCIQRATHNTAWVAS